MVQPTQKTRRIAVFTPFGSDSLLLRRFAGRETLSGLFHFELDMLSLDDALDPRRIVGHNLTFVVRGDSGSPRYFNGIVSRFKQGTPERGFATYSATVVPWLWYLVNTADCRIFQRLSAIQIIEKIFGEYGLQDFRLQLARDYPPREYCVQYRETDFAFVSRLLEEEGIGYRFDHSNGRHVMVLSDDNVFYPEADPSRVAYAAILGQGGDLQEQIHAWSHSLQFCSGRWAHTDYDFELPSKRLAAQEATSHQVPAAQAFEVYDYPGRYVDKDRGTALARVRIQQAEVEHDTAEGQGNYRFFAPGTTFQFAGHPSPAERGRPFLITTVEHTGSVEDSYFTSPSGTTDRRAYENKFTCIPAAVPYRPKPMHARPVVEGPQTAMVVGPSGEQIYTDKHGRVKVQFHWDREGARDDKSSCWLRVSQVHAGQGWGSIDLPRIGEEVVVSFLEGDPDRPMIKGRVYNGSLRPPFALPDAMTRSGGKTNTHKGSGYNESSMDDTAGGEQMRVHAQKDMETTVGNSQTTAVGVDRSASIGNNLLLSVGVDSTTVVGNNAATRVGIDEEVVAGNRIEIESGEAITLQCGLSTIHMNQAGVITISGQFVSSLALASNTIVAPMTEVVGAHVLTQAGLVCLDLAGIKHIKGGEVSVGGAMVNVEGGAATVIKGAPIEIGDAGAPVMAIPAPSASGGEGAHGGGGPDAASGDAGGAGKGAGGGNDQQKANDSEAKADVEKQDDTEPITKKDEAPTPKPTDDVEKRPIPGYPEEDERAGSSTAGTEGQKIGEEEAGAIAKGVDEGSKVADQHKAGKHRQAVDAAEGEARASNMKADAARDAAGEAKAGVERQAGEIVGAANDDRVGDTIAAKQKQDALERDYKSQVEAADDFDARARQAAKQADDLKSKPPEPGKLGQVARLADKVLDVKAAVETGITMGEAIHEGDYRRAGGEFGKTMGGIIAGTEAALVAGAWGAVKCAPAGPVASAACALVAGGGAAYLASSAGEKVGEAVGTGTVDAYNYMTTADPPTPQPNSPESTTRNVSDLPNFCFEGTTLVHTPRGRVPITRLKVGEDVWAWSGREQQVVLRRVIKVMQNPAAETLRLTIGSETIETTALHRFHTVDRGWLPAGQLRAGSCVSTKTGSYESVNQIETHSERSTVYNLEVAEDHNYFIGMGLLVHNMTMRDGSPVK